MTRKIFQIQQHVEHPGCMVKRLLPSLGITDKPATRLARLLHQPRPYITKLLRGQADLTEDIVPRLAMFFNTTPSFWRLAQEVYNESEHSFNNDEVQYWREEDGHNYPVLCPDDSDRESSEGERDVGTPDTEHGLRKKRV